jgi:dTDP-4-amino-4,6-dideoxygalactose transaminase
MKPAYIPYLDLNLYKDSFAQQDLKTFKEIYATGNFIGGTWVATFEKQFSQYCGTAHTVGTSNGLDALTIILKAEILLGNLKSNARILVPAHTYIATFLSIVHAGMQPVPFDVEKLTTTVKVLQKVNESYDAIVVVDIYGKLVEDEVYKFASEKGIPIYCDTAQSHGARNNDGMPAGSLARASAFSFYPSKNLGAIGDAGAITTNDQELADMCRKVANYGRKSRFVNDVIGVNSRLDPLQAGFLLNRLPHLDTFNSKRKDIAIFYYQHINNNKVQLHHHDFMDNNALHVFPVYVKQRELFIGHLHHHGVGTSIHYEIPPHLQPAFQEFNHLHFPITEQLHRTQVSLPNHPFMTHQQLQQVVAAINIY